MGARRTKEPTDGSTETTGMSVVAANEVHLIGRLSAAAELRTLPSEAVMCTFMVIVDRLDSDLRSRQRVDVLGCVAWTPRLRRQVTAWSEATSSRSRVHCASASSARAGERPARGSRWRCGRRAE